MLIHVLTKIDGPQKLVYGVSTYVNPIPGGPPVETDDYLFIEDTDLPVSFEVFCENFDKYEIVAGAVQLISGATIDSRYIESGDVDDTLPQTLSRANKVTIFNAL